MLLNIPLSLIALAIGAFGIGLTEFLIMGLLPEVAHAMNVTIPQAGHFISAYALGVVFGAPLLAIVGRSLPPKKLLIFLMVAFTIFNGLSAVAPNSEALLAFRFLSGLPHGAFFGVGAIVASKLVGPGKAGSAFAVMLGGLTICNVIGVPTATFIGHATSWRIAFGLVSLIGLATITSIAVWIPHIQEEPKRKLAHEFVIFKNPTLWYVIAFASIGFGGFFAWFSYITPTLTRVTGIPLQYVPYLLSLAGLGMTFGNWLGGKLADRIPPVRAATYLILSLTIVLIANALLASHVWPIFFLTFITGANSMALGAPIQLLLIEASKESPFLGSSVGQSAFNLGNSLGAFLAGLPLAAGYGLTSPLWVGSLLTFAGLIIILRLRPKTVSLDIVTFNYLNRPIYDVFIDGKSGDSSTAYPATGGSTICGVKLKLGPKLVTWKLDGKRGTPRNGETVTAKNALQLTHVPKGTVFLAVHIYPDETVELIPSRHYPVWSAKGRAMAESAH